MCERLLRYLDYRREGVWAAMDLLRCNFCLYTLCDVGDFSRMERALEISVNFDILNAGGMQRTVPMMWKVIYEEENTDLVRGQRLDPNFVVVAE
jgi:hypothetical protein